MPTISTLVVEVDAKTSKFSAGAKTAVAGLGALAVGAAYAYNEFTEANKVAQQTDAVLKSTGGAANVTATEVSDLATALSEKSGVDDEVIQSGENMLLTFKNIENAAGKNNDIFNQASATTLDMAAGMAAASGGTVDMKSASIQLGKALNDPVAGISALSRIGVTFTEQQKKQIEQMVKSGDTLGAQKMILKEVNSEFKGSAAASKTAAGTMSVSLGNLAESVGQVLAPAINSVIGLAITFITWLTKYPAILVAVGAAVAILTAAWLAQKAIAGITMIQEVIHTGIIVAQTAAQIAAAAAIGIVTAAQWLWNAAMSANPIGLIIIAIAAVIGVIVLLVKHFHLADDIMNVLKKTVDVVWGFIKTAIGIVVKAVVIYIKIWIAIIKTVITVVKSIAGFVKDAFVSAYNFVKEWLGKAVDFIVKAWDAVVGFVGRLGSRMARGARNIWDWIVAGIKAAINTAIGMLNQLINFMNAVQIHVHIDPPGPGQIDFDWSGLGIPTVPTLQTGGLVKRTGLALVHEGERFSGVGGGWGGTVNVYVQGSVQTEKDLAETIQKTLLRSKRRSGSLGLS